MLTLFTTPKPFYGHIGIIQRNAIGSWCRLRPPVDIIVFGDADGAAEAAARCGARHIPKVGKNEYGTPLVSAMFEEAERLSDTPLMCYVNADIILMSDFSVAIKQVAACTSFLFVGRRVDLDLEEPCNFDERDWEEQLRARVASNGVLHSVTGIDYFVYRRGLWGDIPPLAIGRSAWDNWLVYRARAKGAKVIDATHYVTVIHQNHDYQHHPDQEVGVWKGNEAKRNQELTGGPRYEFSLADATHRLTSSGVRLALGMAHLKRRLVTAPLFFPHLDPIVSPLVRVTKFVRNLSIRKAT